MNMSKLWLFVLASAAAMVIAAAIVTSEPRTPMWHSVGHMILDDVRQREPKEGGSAMRIEVREERGAGGKANVLVVDVNGATVGRLLIAHGDAEVLCTVLDIGSAASGVEFQGPPWMDDVPGEDPGR